VTQAPLDGTFRRAWQLLARNWVIIVPALVVGVITGAVLYLLDAYGAISVGSLDELNGGGPAAFTAFIGSIVAILVRIVGAIVSIAYTTGMAAAAWKRGSATLADGTAAFRADAGQIFIAMLLLFLLGLIAATFMDFTYYTTLLLYAIFVLYTMPAVIVGQRSGVDALVESFRIAGKNFWTTLGVVVLIGLIAAAGGIVAELVHDFPLLGQIVALVLMEAVVAYATLVVVGEYIALRPTLDRPAEDVPPPPAAS
jgi:cytochrome c oxidase subunit IV